MRCRITGLFLIALYATTASGQGQPRSGAGNSTIKRNWPDDGAQQGSALQPSWDGPDAVGLQFRDTAAVKPQFSAVPVSMLRISGAALKEMQKSDKALKAGDVRQSADHLEKMLVLTPDLAVGHNMLGTRYVAIGDYEKALNEFQKAVAIQPNYRIAVDNMTVAMCIQHKYAAAEPYARWALQIQPEAPTSRYLLGSILISQGKSTDEALRLLQGVKEQYPRARLFIANTLVTRGQLQQAAEEIREYVNSPRATDNGVAQEWLGRLEKQLDAQKREAGQPQ